MITDYFTVHIKASLGQAKKRKIEIIVSEEEEEEIEGVHYDLVEGEKVYIPTLEEFEEMGRQAELDYAEEEKKNRESLSPLSTDFEVQLEKEGESPIASDVSEEDGKQEKNEEKVAMALTPKRTKLVWLDAVDEQWAGQYKWHDNGRGYAERTVYVYGGKKRNMKLHREILKRKLDLDELPKGMYVDHIDGNTLNNTRSNLRLCTPTQSARNRKRPRNNTSSQKGVYWDKDQKKWRAEIYDIRKIDLGRYNTLQEAAEVRRKAEEELFGEFTRKEEALVVDQ